MFYTPSPMAKLAKGKRDNLPIGDIIPGDFS
jgi:hypothetical protein